MKGIDVELGDIKIEIDGLKCRADYLECAEITTTRMFDKIEDRIMRLEGMHMKTDSSYDRFLELKAMLTAMSEDMKQLQVQLKKRIKDEDYLDEYFTDGDDCMHEPATGTAKTGTSA